VILVQVTGLKASPDIPGKAFDLTAVKSKKAVTPYRPPGPGPGTGTHRYGKTEIVLSPLRACRS
jgi:hypothetical protein